MAARTAATPVPLRVTGDPATVTLAVMVTVPPYVVVVVGANCTTIVQVPGPASVVPHVPPAAPAGREKPAGKVPTAIPVSGACTSVVKGEGLRRTRSADNHVPVNVRGPGVTFAMAAPGAAT